MERVCDICEKRPSNGLYNCVDCDTDISTDWHTNYFSNRDLYKKRKQEKKILKKS